MVSPVPGLRSQSNLEVPYLEMLSSVSNTASRDETTKSASIHQQRPKAAFLLPAATWVLLQTKAITISHLHLYCSEIDVSL